TETAVQYNYYGEGIPISTPKSKISQVKTRTGRVVVFENTAIKKNVFNCEDWEKVVVTSVEDEVKNMVRSGNVSGKAKGQTTLTQAGKMQDRAMNKMKMQAAFRGCDVVFMLSSQVEGASYGYYSSKAAEANIQGTAYSTKTITPFSIIPGQYTLQKVYRLKPNQYNLKEYSSQSIIQNIVIKPEMFNLNGSYYSIQLNTGIPDSGNKMDLISVSEDEIVFLVIDNSNQSKMIYYNLFFKKAD
ncbi:MAG: hypothetical protein LPK80_05225, partial [Bacteroidota bacterium]|nr:hypothetical protein [Bacteroidota bacterium]